MKRFLGFAFITALLFCAIAIWLAPRAISWYFTPPADLILACNKAVDWGLETYRRCMIVALIVGFVVGGLLFFAFGKKKQTTNTL